MSRPLRLEYPDAWYHVMNRGSRAENIFKEEQDYVLFIDVLKEAAELWNIGIAAYCLMPNHYHMLVQTPQANISRSMRHINGVYTQRYNSRHGYDGPLFRGRYKSILIDTDSYLLQAVRYIHRNPLRAGIVEGIDNYKWSSHKGYLSVAPKWDWLNKNKILSMLAKNRKDWLRYYKNWVSIEEEDEVDKAINSKKWPLCIGPQAFIDRIKEKFGGKIFKEIPSSRELLPETERIVDAVCSFYNVAVGDITKTRRGRTNEVRDAAIYLLRKLRRDTLNKIGERFQIGTDSSVSSVIERMNRRMNEDHKMKEQIRKIEGLIITGQKET